MLVGGGTGGSKGGSGARKRGEMADLRDRLRVANNDRTATSAALPLVDKVVSFMTLGIDTSSLFPEMAMASNTRNLAQKKLVYLYLCHNAETQPDVSLLCVNTLQRDATDSNPIVRGLALRSIASLRVPNIVEYVFPLIAAGLGDTNAYVRKTAAIAAVKFYKTAPDIFIGSDMTDKLYQLLRDSDPVVVVNAINALNEVLRDSGGPQIPNELMISLLQRLREFNEWGQCVILNLTESFEPQNEDEILAILNLLDEKLKHTNSSVVMAVCGVFLRLTQHHPVLHQSVCARIKSPLLLHITTTHYPEVAYPLMCHLKLLLSRVPTLLENDYKSFYIRSNDPTYLKTLKIELLTSIANEKSAPYIIEELFAYATDVDMTCACKALTALGTIALKVPSIVTRILSKFIDLIALDIDYIAAEAILALKDIFRKYPTTRDEILDLLESCISVVSSPQAKAAVVWMIGDFGETLESAPYILEDLVDTWEELDEEVQLQLLTATMKMYFKRPQECQPILGQLLNSAINNTVSIDTHDKALLYYRLLAYNPQEAARVVCASKIPISTFSEQAKSEIDDQLFEEFNTLSVVYHKPEKLFTKPKPIIQPIAAPSNTSPTPLSKRTPATSTAIPQASQSQQQQHVSGNRYEFMLEPSPKMPAEVFQRKWQAATTCETVEKIWLGPIEPLIASVKSNTHCVACMASGIVANTAKIYAYAVDQLSGVAFLIEIIVRLTPPQNQSKLVATIKSEDPLLAKQFAAYFTQHFLAY
ncbi:AP-4 complex subunit beta-1 [Pelomyxa schiedti]|nr:AP-4 complex subunit beta-1 [Pelomyxa schiedti]